MDNLQELMPPTSFSFSFLSHSSGEKWEKCECARSRGDGDRDDDIMQSESIYLKKSLKNLLNHSFFLSSTHFFSLFAIFKL